MPKNTRDLIQKYFPQAVSAAPASASTTSVLASPSAPATTPAPVTTKNITSATKILKDHPKVSPTAIDSNPNSASDKTVTFGINGFGRIGRTAFRVWWQKYRADSQLKVINTSGSMELADWIHLIKYDSNYGIFNEKITIESHQKKDQVSDQNPVLGTISLGQHKIVVTAQRDPHKIPWAANGVEVVIDATGVFNTEEKAAAHFDGGAKYVILSAPAKGGQVDTSVIGVNTFDPQIKVKSNASCTTNCVAPVVKIMVDHFGVKKAILTTIHSYTDDQNTQDNSHKKDMRRARSAAENLIPTSTGAALATTKIIPQLEGLFDGLAVRVPTPVGSLSDMVFLTEKSTSVEEVNQVFQEASTQPQWQDILAVTTEPIVSSDIVGRDESSIVDLSLTKVIGGDLVKIISWYDNEWGYCCRLVEQLNKLSI